ncbi:cob(I)yrinic acid a,c-diamide adenosyltransferase [Fibrobacterales bacterium]|nr:cob(I)yrinic acid a,c-diamide adenosyltransferase [Fibrobacterales bacterium]
MNLTKIYTRGGDKGKTSLIGGERISKSSTRLEAYGTLDELNAFVGQLRVDAAHTAFAIKDKNLSDELGYIQRRIFDAGTILATPEGKEWEGMPNITEKHIEELEIAIDKMNAELKPLKTFTVPGSDPLNAKAHICRTVCRRAERVLCFAKENGVAVSDSVMAYINRLSDYFFVLSRFVSKESELLL